MPDDPRYDPALLADGDRRNVVDEYRYWSLEAIRADLAARARPFHVAVENWEHDFNIGAIVRTANAFGAGGVHIVGKRRWNRRGAMVTDRYLNVVHHADVDGLRSWVDGHGLALIGIENVPQALPLEQAVLPERCVLLFGQEGPGLTPAALAGSSALYRISQCGSTRSLNAAAAAAIAMYHWSLNHSHQNGDRPLSGNSQVRA
ncbi:MAG: RNA methyltransferase [Bifidobacteriaceae bacterium]|nr:RNA methyltransferase [Bifidobacteriaceae bacterium]